MKKESLSTSHPKHPSIITATLPHSSTDNLSEWLRRQTRNLLGSARASSNPAAVAFFFSTHNPHKRTDYSSSSSTSISPPSFSTSIPMPPVSIASTSLMIVSHFSFRTRSAYSSPDILYPYARQQRLRRVTTCRFH